MGLTGRNHVVGRFGLLQHLPHCDYVLPRMSPIALGVQVTQPQLGRLTCGNSRHEGTDLASYEFESAAWRLVIKKDPTQGECLVSLAVVADQLVSADLADSVARSGMKACALCLWYIFHLTEHFARPREVQVAV